MLQDRGINDSSTVQLCFFHSNRGESKAEISSCLRDIDGVIVRINDCSKIIIFVSCCSLMMMISRFRRSTPNRTCLPNYSHRLHSRERLNQPGSCSIKLSFIQQPYFKMADDEDLNPHEWEKPVRSQYILQNSIGLEASSSFVVVRRFFGFCAVKLLRRNCCYIISRLLAWQWTRF